jgi:hypothetical protein
MGMKKPTDAAKASKKVDGFLAKGYKVVPLKLKTVDDLKPKKDDKKKAVGKKKK